MKSRIFEDCNYKAVYDKGITIRSKCSLAGPILELNYPEFWDVKITNCCNASPSCSYCYMDSKWEEPLHPVLEKFEGLFSRLTKNQRPFQIAFGGGEPTIHPQFIQILESCYRMGIVPNYTTNGTNFTESILKATANYCGGVAVSAHEQLDWRSGIQKFFDTIYTKLNLHIVINDKDTIDYFMSVYNEYKNKNISYFVLLPYVEKGRAKNKNIDYEYLKKMLVKCDLKRLAFGAHFYDFLRTENPFNEIVSLYEPEIFSKFLDLTTMKVYKNSFEV
jgi:organic radical activating enzyme